MPTISFRIYQANRLEQRAENQYVAGIIIIESPCSSTEESEYKSLSYDSKGNFFFFPGWMDCPCLPPPAFERQLHAANAISRYFNRTVTLIKHSAAFIIYSVILHCKLFCREFSYKQVTL